MFPIQSTTDDEKLWVDSVFSTYLYTGNGSTQTITNGIDLAGKGGMVWIKDRNDTVGHFLFDSARASFDNSLSSNTTAAQSTGFSNTPLSNGITVGDGVTNFNGRTFVSWTFRKAPKFFDVVTWTGDGGTQTISHSLGQVPGMIIVKDTSSGTTDGWYVWHRGLTSGNYILLNQTAAQTTSSAKYIFGNNTITVDPTSSQFTVGANTAVNGAVGHTYVAHLFADDPSTDGMIQCGSFTVVGPSTPFNLTLNYEPQFLLVKNISRGSTNWHMLDVFRGLPINNQNGTAILSANLSSAESTGGALGIQAALSPTGVSITLGDAGGADTYIYLAIRRPNKPPTSGTQVYNAIARTGTGAATTVTGVGFAPDLVFIKDRAGGYEPKYFDRLRGSDRRLYPCYTDAESLDSTGACAFDKSDGVGVAATTNFSATNYINHFFRRAPGFFDVVCYTGTGSATTVAHNLGAVPELMIVKERNSTSEWPVYAQPIGNDRYLLLNANNAQSAIYSGTWNSTPPTATVFSLGTDIDVNTNNNTYVACLFATLPGISKVGSYTGNGTSQTINCGFTTGARFILIKRTDSTGDWYVWDSARGIIAGNDPHLSLNTTAAEVTTDDSVDPDNSGFIVNQVAATNINVTSASYIFLAVA